MSILRGNDTIIQGDTYRLDSNRRKQYETL
jgi:hypothetical protein